MLPFSPSAPGVPGSPCKPIKPLWPINHPYSSKTFIQKLFVNDQISCSLKFFFYVWFRYLQILFEWHFLKTIKISIFLTLQMVLVPTFHSFGTYITSISFLTLNSGRSWFTLLPLKLNQKNDRYFRSDSKNQSGTLTGDPSIPWGPVSPCIPRSPASPVGPGKPCGPYRITSAKYKYLPTYRVIFS